MTGETHDVGARLRELVLAGDPATLRVHLDGLAGGHLKAARAWVAATHDVDAYPWPPELGDPADPDHYGRVQRMRLGRLTTWSRLGAPAAAVKAVAAESTFLTHEQLAELAGAFVDRDRAWAEAFARAADAVRPSARGAGVLFVLLRSVVEAHGLPAPAGALFQGGWIRALAYADEERDGPAVDRLRRDPLLPEVVHLQLASGQCGTMPAFARALSPLVAEGILDRERLVSDALAHLTAGQRPSSQRVLAGILTELDVSAEEVPGGLDVLLSILSTCHGSVARQVLSLALDLVRTGEQAVELARVVAPRSEKGVRRALLAALSPDDLGRRTDHAPLLEAVDVLAAADEDVTDAARYDKARLALGGPAGVPAQAAAALGLWDLSLPPATSATTWGSPHRQLRDRLWRAMRTGTSSPDDGLTDALLDALAQGALSPAEMAATAHELAVEGALSPARAASVLEPLFLGGAMRATWPVALEIADLCAAAPRPTPGLDRLLGFLATYAVEVPGPVDLPAHLVRLVGGRSKTAQEAGRLATLLGASLAPREPVPTHLALWTERSEPVPWALAYPPTRDLGTLGARIARTPLGRFDVPGAVRRRVLTSLLLDELAALVDDHGAPAVRDALGDRPAPRDAGRLAQAVALWAQGLLTPESYWAIARTTATVHDLLPTWLQETDPAEAHTRYFEWTVQDGLVSTPPVMPRWWSDPRGGAQARLEFLHACEVLLVVERGGRMVSTTDVIDGTLGLDHLRERLAATPRVGPIDLRLALGRLRPADRGGAAGAVLGRLAGLAAVTDAAVTSPDGSREHRASDVVHRWVDGGGLRLEQRGTDVPHRWTYDADCPVRWGWCEALAGTPVADGPPHARADDAFTVPGRPDVWLRQGFHAIDGDDSLADVGGRIGVHGWSVILDALGAPSPALHLDPDFAALVRLQDQDRLDPAAAVAAAGARWDESSPVDARGALGWERAMLRGALRGLWPVAVAIAGAGLARAARPPELDALLDVLRRRVHEVPAELVPDFLADA